MNYNVRRWWHGAKYDDKDERMKMTKTRFEEDEHSLFLLDFVLF